MNKPVITVQEDLDSGEFILMATSYGQTMPGGPRLFRASPYPDIKFTHTSEADALRDAQLLRRYIEDCWPKKAMSKAAIRRAGE